MVLKPGKEAMAEAIFRKWELDFAVIGEVTDTGNMVLTFQGETVCNIPLGPLAEDAPLYDRPAMSLADYKAWAGVKPLGDVPASTDLGADLLKLIGCPDLASRRWIWEQYDSQVGADTLQKSGGDAAVVRLHGTQKALAMSTDCTPRYCYADPYEGGKQAVAETYRNISAVGATPLAITNCLNFANPQRPEIMAQIVEALRGMGDACRALDYPIVSGNVSLYNETNGQGILPTPTIGGVGLIDDWSKMAKACFANEGEVILLVGGPAQWGSHLAQSIYMRDIHGRTDGPAPTVDLEHEKKAGDFVRKLIRNGTATAVHDLSDGGLAVALAEMAMASGIGATVPGLSGTNPIPVFFGEDQGRYLVTVKLDPQSAEMQELWNEAKAHGIHAPWIGTTGGKELKLGTARAVSVDELTSAHESWFPRFMNN